MRPLARCARRRQPAAIDGGDTWFETQLRRQLGLAEGEELAYVNAPRRALRELTSTRRSLDGLEAALVRQARLAGSTWAQIAADLELSRPTAQRRHAAGDPMPKRRRRRRDPWLPHPRPDGT